MRHVVASAIPLLLLSFSFGTARAGDRTADDARDKEKPVVLLNATAKLGDLGPVDKIRRVLDTRGLLLDIPEGLAATLEGRNVQIADLEAIRDAYKNAKFNEALRLVEENELRILQNAGGDPMPALAELSQWRGLISIGRDEKDEAVAWFRAALRFNPAWTLDSSLAGPTVARLVKKARKEAIETGKLRVDAEPVTATVQIDGGKAQALGEKLVLPIGHHLVTVTAEGRTSYSELVEIAPDKTSKLAISLEKESKTDRAARLVDATVAAPPGEARLRKVKGMSRFVGATRFLVIEDTSPDRTVVRVYDVDMKKISKQIDVEGTASSAAIARKVLA
ncbi:MAG TPA: PEGA domain-containing protein, partial [Kofleriaceae bacterium]|nr:PEGA domain-containing protein [Kofleriaceae bacterium]